MQMTSAGMDQHVDPSSCSFQIIEHIQKEIVGLQEKAICLREAVRGPEDCIAGEPVPKVLPDDGRGLNSGLSSIQSRLCRIHDILEESLRGLTG